MISTNVRKSVRGLGGAAPLSPNADSWGTLTVPGTPTLFSPPTGYYIWGGLIYEDGGTYYMLYSRWPDTVGNVFDDDWQSSSEIAIASAGSFTGPYTHVSVLLQGAGSGWDAQAVHAPSLIRDAGGKWRLYYWGNTASLNDKQLGVATADAITGPYTRSANNPILGPGAGSAWDNRQIANPSVFKRGSYYYMTYKGENSTDGPQKRRVGFASAPYWDGPWTKEATNPVIDYNDFGGMTGGIEDVFVWYEGERLRLVAHEADFPYANLEILWAWSYDAISWTEPTGGYGVVQDSDFGATTTRLEYPRVFLVDGVKTYFYASRLDNADNSSIVYGTLSP